MAIEAKLSLCGLSPLALHRTRAGRQFTETLDYVPGSTLRGALAEAYLVQHGMNADDPDFKALFVSGQVSYPDLWPTIPSTNTVLLPISARICKRHGFDHYDSLCDGLLTRAYRSTNDKKPLCMVCLKDDKEEDLDRARGYLQDLATKKPLRLAYRLRMNVAMERAIGSQASGLLFSHQTVQTHAEVKDGEVLFTGIVRAESEAQYQTLKAFAPKETTLSLGASRSRGLGEAEIIDWQENTTANPPLSERWGELNNVAALIGAPKRVFSITLMSHLILRDKLLHPKLEKLDSGDFGLPSNLKCAACFTNAIVVPGWNSALGMPKPDSIALCRGSVWLFEVEEQFETEVFQQLGTLEKEGLGERRAEGFGRVLACAPFHYKYVR
jgi:CRISPR-associated protein Csx10